MFDSEKIIITPQEMRHRAQVFLAPLGVWETFCEAERELDTVAKRIFQSVAAGDVPYEIPAHRQLLNADELKELLVGAHSLGSEFQTLNAAVYLHRRGKYPKFEDGLKAIVESFEGPSQLDKFDHGALGVVRQKVGREGETLAQALIRCPNEIEAWALANADHMHEGEEALLGKALERYRAAYHGVQQFVGDARDYLEPLGRVNGSGSNGHGSVRR